MYTAPFGTTYGAPMGAPMGGRVITPGVSSFGTTGATYSAGRVMGGSVMGGSVIGGSYPGPVLSSGYPSVGTLPPRVVGGPVYGGGYVGGGRVVYGSAPRYTLGQYSAKAYEAKHITDSKLNNLKEVRAASGLQYIPVGTGLITIKQAAQGDKFEKAAFTAAYVQLLEAHSIDAPSQDVCNAVFELFDRDSNGIVDMMELVCGMSLLCQGTEQEKIEAVFSAFDVDGDKFVSMDEMNKFLLSVFRVVLTPAVIGIMRAQGVEVDSPEDLAWVTTQECFKDADKNHDKKLSLEEFSRWFNEPSTDPSLVFSPIKNIFH